LFTNIYFHKMIASNHTSFQFDEFEKELRQIEHPINIVEEKASHLADTLKKAVKNDYNLFLKSDDRGKEDIIIQWERIKNEASKMILSKPFTGNENSNSTQGKIHNLFNAIVDFEQKLRNEFYTNPDRVYSQKELENMASKYSGFPDSILDDISSDKYAKRYL